MRKRSADYLGAGEKLTRVSQVCAFLQPQFYVPIWFMEQHTDEPTAETLPATARRDGWTPFARRLFLEVLAETGRVSRACEYAQLTAQSAYALRARDRLFAASWDAACELARAPLADTLYKRRSTA